ncbi:haloacid dehalogenase [[Actinobacillus] muris]|uniref:phosphoglycolate phosphatase n=1 Tax=Muribacter muris TaxID=67855 RepID=A0A0J5S5K3_9PAST|nr:HAD hydrolase-like protein [Muribacter muris]KMK52122.1 haloacid dehalogenase [[Actinobacillus] muris] [Muribacter muris]
MGFEKNHNVIVCIDSDGCAMDTMNLKHQRCFGPYAVEVFGLRDRERFIAIWDRLNLYSQTRGINRFKGLVLGLKAYGYELDIQHLTDWVNSSRELSNRSLMAEFERVGSADLRLALDWSEKVNEGIKALRHQDAPFGNVKRSLEMITQFADVAVVSSANNDAIIDEWSRHHLLPYVNVVFGQEQGSKAFALNQLKQYGYQPEQILMVGDSPGDLGAAQEARTLFFPILCHQESESWDRLVLEALGKLVFQKFDDTYQQQLIATFQQHLTASEE